MIIDQLEMQQIPLFAAPDENYPDEDELPQRGDLDDEEDINLDDVLDDEDDIREIRTSDDLHEPDPEDDDHLPDEELQ